MVGISHNICFCVEGCCELYFETEEDFENHFKNKSMLLHWGGYMNRDSLLGKMKSNIVTVKFRDGSVKDYTLQGVVSPSDISEGGCYAMNVATQIVEYFEFSNVDRVVDVRMLLVD